MSLVEGTEHLIIAQKHENNLTMPRVCTVDNLMVVALHMLMISGVNLTLRCTFVRALLCFTVSGQIPLRTTDPIIHMSDCL